MSKEEQPTTAAIPVNAPPPSPARRSVVAGETPPKRRSISDRVSEGVAPKPGDLASYAITDTSLTTVTAHTFGDAAFRIDNTGIIAPDEVAAPIAAPLERSGPLTPIDRKTATQHHLLIVEDEVEDEEIEALAVSVWSKACWIGPGILRLRGGARMEGPWSLPDDLRAEFGIPDEMTHVWVLVCRPKRGPKPSEDAIRMNRWARAFPYGVPVDLEMEILDVMERMARRLAGCIRIAGSGEVLQRDPESAVSLLLCSPRWVPPTELIPLLAEPFPDVVDSREIPTGEIPQLTDDEMKKIEAVRSRVGAMPSEAAQRIDVDRRTAAAGEQIVDGYALVMSVGNRSKAVLEVRRAGVLPQSVRWEPWARGTVIEYRMRWLPAGNLGSGEVELTRAARMERSRAAADIETAITILANAVGGSVVDEDGFLVALD
ncbi:MAG: hypothetical protein Q4C87_09210 [Actinomycetaceae bacterium]|nr:hypothetical protein [Actinomycetaceae bacterium]